MAHAEKLLTDNIDVWAAAIKHKNTQGRGSSKKTELYGIKKLRELILELAVRGLLVPQDPNDEPASVLLKKIAVEKARLVKEGKIKKQKKLPPISDEGKPFDLPKTWCWQRYVDVFYPISVSKNKIKTSEIQADGAVPVVDQGQSYIAGYTEKEELEIQLPGPVIVFGDHTSALKYINFNFVAGADGVKILRPICSDEKYFYVASKTLPIENRGYGRHYSRLTDNYFPLPPLEEQRRIVAKVDELMALCDQLEQRTETSLSAHQTLVGTLLGALTATHSQNTHPARGAASGGKTDNARFTDAWQRIAAHFDTLFTTEHSIDQLKQTILQLAVQGKLVPQDPNDEPASELLKKIAAEKAKLIKEGKSKKQKVAVTFAGLDELKTDLPSYWEWIRLSDIADIVRGGSPRPAGDPRYYDGQIPFLKVGDITRKTGKFVEGFNATIKEAGLNRTRLIEIKTVLLSNSGATLGIPAICDFPATFNDGIAAFIEKSEYISDEYLYLYLSTLSRWFLDIASRGQGQPNLNTDIIKSTWLALPPHEEQHRIVAKVDELMAVCDQLKTCLGDAQSTQLHLADAMAEQAIA